MDYRRRRREREARRLKRAKEESWLLVLMQRLELTLFYTDFVSEMINLALITIFLYVLTVLWLI